MRKLLGKTIYYRKRFTLSRYHKTSVNFKSASHWITAVILSMRSVFEKNILEKDGEKDHNYRSDLIS